MGSGTLHEGTLRFGYQDIPDELRTAREWAEVEKLALLFSKDGGAATKRINQNRQFHKTPKTTRKTLNAPEPLEAILGVKLFGPTNGGSL